MAENPAPARALAPLARVRGTLRVPGDKSISHRGLLFGAFAEGTTRLVGLSPGGDVRSTRECLETLGIVIEDRGPEVQHPRALEQLVQQELRAGAAAAFDDLVERGDPVVGLALVAVGELVLELFEDHGGGGSGAAQGAQVDEFSAHPGPLPPNSDARPSTPRTVPG